MRSCEDAPELKVGRRLPALGITMGDPAGIGPEVILKALNHTEVYQACSPVVIGSVDVLEHELETLPAEFRGLQVKTVRSPSPTPVQPGVVFVIDPGLPGHAVVKGKLSAECGAAAVAYVKYAWQLATERLIDGMVTAPLNKAAMHMSGHPYPGHTELLAGLFGVSKYSMVLCCGDFFVLHVTTHVPLSGVSRLITVDNVLEKIRIAAVLALALNLTEKPIAVAALNPHAGEGGIFGREEIDIIQPAVERARQEGINVSGPFPADAVFPKAAAGGYNFVVAMYHDQGHVPFKTLYFDRGVNVTVGLPVVRTSVDHGTAFDIAGKGIAKEDSMLQAILAAARLAPVWDRVYSQLREAGCSGPNTGGQDNPCEHP